MASNAGGYVLIFGVGVAIGSFVTWRWLRHSYDEELEKNIDAVRSFYNELYVKKSEPAKEKKTETPLSEKVEVFQDETGTHKIYRPDIEYISPVEFGEDEEYDKIELSYFADGVLADDLEEKVDDYADAVGKNFADHFGEFEPDSVYVRNDRRKAYFEILRDLRYFKDVEKTRPHRVAIE